MSDIVTRLRQTRVNMIGTDDEQHYWDCHDAAAEIVRLRLTDAEREAVRKAAFAYAQNDDDSECAEIASALLGLAERMK